MISRSNLCGLTKNTARSGLRRLAPARFFTTRHTFQQPKSQKSLPLAAVLAGASLVAGTSIALFRSRPIDLDAQNPGVSADELRKHNSLASGIWVAINGQVYDLTEFLSVHPGGASIIKQYAGKNASKIFNKFHSPDFIRKYLAPENCLGPLIGEAEEAADITEAGDDAHRQVYRDNLPPLTEIFTVTDFEYIAKKTCSPSAWYYYSSGLEDEVTLRENHNAFSRIFFKPRVLVDVGSVDLSTEMLGTKTSLPFYVSAAAQAKLGHPDGELSICRGSGAHDVIQMVSHFSSYSIDSIMQQAGAGQSHWYQLYVLNREAAKETVQHVAGLGVKALFVTVDTPELGRREKDMKLRAQMDARVARAEAEAKQDEKTENTKNSETDTATAPTESGARDDLKSNVIYGRDLSVTWDGIREIQLWSDLPLAIKGVQTVEDIVLAAERGIQAVVLSNHGGRQLDYSRAPIEVLADAMPVLREKGLQDKIEIYIDGGVRRGGDIIKCLALGAKGVGLGRVFLYANACYGEAGVRKAIELLKEEIRVDMRLLGVSKIADLGPQHLDLRNLYARASPRDNLYYGNYEPLAPPRFAHED